jgi:hypothetical protein
MARGRIAVLVVNIVVFCVFAELVSLVVYYYQTGHLFYLHRKTYQVLPDTREGRLTGEGLHPYFGPTHKSGIPFDLPEKLQAPRVGEGGGSEPSRVETNNFGFVSPHNYPFVKQRDDQFVIGLFGGSVGVWFCQVGAGRLVERLQQNGFFKRRALIPLCLSHEGYKQPQQLLVLAYFLSIGQQFDLVVNIDGFNEVALSSINDQHGVDISMPSFQHLDPLINLVNQSTLTPEKLQSLAAIDRYKNQLNDLTDGIRRNRIASVNFVLEQYHRIVSNRYRAELGNFARLPSNASSNSIVTVTPAVTGRDRTSLFEDIARNWVSASTLMNALLSPRRVPYFHFLQPNQYYATRTFGEEEARTVLNDTSPYKPSVEKGYPVLVAASQSSAQTSATRFFDATHIFDREAAPVYMDNCCHYTLVGNRILADFIAASILRSDGAWSAAND